LIQTERSALFHITETTSLRILCREDAPELFAVTDANRRYLRRWLPWLDAVQTEAHTREFIESAIRQRESGFGPTFSIRYRGAVAGVIGFHPIDRVHRVGDIGYWLAEKNQRKGIMTECCRFVVRYGFYTLDLNRIQIPVATGNRRSRMIPERLGFRFEGILRERENLYGRFVDHAMYAMLRSELSDDF
jgi:ribosomal-protein-serine acetyltransferase